MKTKGISIWEQHIQWIVLGLAVVAFVAFTTKQFVGEPNAVSMGGRQVAPGEVDRLLEEDAERLAARLAPLLTGTMHRILQARFPTNQIGKHHLTCRACPS